MYLLELPERSLEARFLMAVADEVSRRRFGNQAMLLGQIGIEQADPLDNDLPGPAGPTQDVAVPAGTLRYPPGQMGLDQEGAERVHLVLPGRQRLDIGVEMRRAGRRRLGMASGLRLLV